MSKAVELVTFKLREGVSVEDFLTASEKMNRAFLSAQPGYISRKLLAQGESWADLVLWASMDDALKAAQSEFNEAYADAMDYFSMIENAAMSHFSVEQSFQLEG